MVAVEQRAEVDENDERLSETDCPATIEHEVGGVPVFVRQTVLAWPVLGSTWLFVQAPGAIHHAVTDTPPLGFFFTSAAWFLGPCGGFLVPNFCILGGLQLDNRQIKNTQNRWFATKLQGNSLV
jgi:hypothetical protein